MNFMKQISIFSALGIGGCWLRVFCGAVVVMGASMIVNATEVVPPTFTELVNRADYVVRAQVVAVRAEIQAVGTGKKIMSFVELEVLETIAGNPPEQLVLTVLGGRVGRQEMVVEGAPKFVEGLEAVFFVEGNGRQIYPLVGMMYGLYPVIRDDEQGEEGHVVRSNGEPLTTTAEVSTSLREHSGAANEELQSMLPPMTAEMFAQRIRSTRKSP